MYIYTQLILKEPLACLAARFAFRHHFLQQFHVLVIDVHRTWSVPIDEDWVFFAGAGTNSRSLSGATASAHWARRHGGLGIEANGLYGRPLHWVVDSPERKCAGSDARIRELEQCETKYVGEESYSQGEVGPGFALSRKENLCHISQSLQRVGFAAVRQQVCLRFGSLRVPLAASRPLGWDSTEFHLITNDCQQERSRWLHRPTVAATR